MTQKQNKTEIRKEILKRLRKHREFMIESKTRMEVYNKEMNELIKQMEKTDKELSRLL